MSRSQRKEITLMQAAHWYAEYIAPASACDRASHACVITDTNLDVVSIGYNGPERGAEHTCAREEEGNCGCVHAEANALVKPQRQVDAKIAFITAQPCERCAKLLVNAGVVMVVFSEGHRPYPEGLSVLDRAGIAYGDTSYECMDELSKWLLLYRARRDVVAMTGQIIDAARDFTIEQTNQVVREINDALHPPRPTI